MAYRRASQVVERERNDVKKELQFLAKGLNAAREGCENEEDVISFLVEICTLIPRIPSYHKKDLEITHILNGIIKFPDESDDIWMKVVERLIAKQAWEGVALLFIYPDDVIASEIKFLDFSELNCEKISVGNILLQLLESKISFGDELIMSMCCCKADIEDIGRTFDCPTLHYIVRTSLRHGYMMLLRHITQLYQNSHTKMNVVDKDGSTALHILVHEAKAGSPSENVVEVLDILLRSKCDATIVDNDKKKPIDYITDKQSILYEKLFPVSTKSG